jgi:hypothetical protein
LMVLAGTCVASGQLLESLREKAVQSARLAADKAVQERRSGKEAGPLGGGSQPAAAAPSAKKGGKGAGGGGEDDSDEDWGVGKKGGKKGGKGGGAAAGKGAGKGGKGGAAGAAGGKADAGGDRGHAPMVGLSLGTISALVLQSCPDMEGAGDAGLFPSPAAGGGGGEEQAGLAACVAGVLLPSCVAAYEAGLKAALTAGAEARKKVRGGMCGGEGSRNGSLNFGR